jgi:nicotinamidase-related amidase
MLTAPVPAFRLTSRNAALLLIDVQRFTTRRDEGFGRLAAERGISREFDEYFLQVDAALENTARLLGACRAHGLRIVYTVLSTGAADDGQVGRQLRTTRLPLPGGAPEAEIRPEVAPAPDDLVLSRTTYSPFARTNLEEQLRRAHVDTLIIAGMLANISVLLAAREAADRDFNVIVVRDASASETLDWHMHTMNAVVGGLIRVRSVQQVVEMLEGTRT